MGVTEKYLNADFRLVESDLAKIIGANRVSEVLQGKRGLTINMIRNLHTALHIPTSSLVN